MIPQTRSCRVLTARSHSPAARLFPMFHVLDVHTNFGDSMPTVRVRSVAGWYANHWRGGLIPRFTVIRPSRIRGWWRLVFTGSPSCCAFRFSVGWWGWPLPMRHSVGLMFHQHPRVPRAGRPGFAAPSRSGTGFSWLQPCWHFCRFLHLLPWRHCVVPSDGSRHGASSPCLVPG